MTRISTPRRERRPPDEVPDQVAGVEPDAIEAVMAAARVLVAVSAQSGAELADTVTLAQLRLLVMIESRSPMNLAAVAEGLGVHPSNATRAVDRLVSQGLLARRDDPSDRRHLLLEPTEAGTDLVDQVMRHRRAAIGRAMAGMTPEERRALRTGAAAFATAAGDPPDTAVWEAGWPTE